MLSIDSLDSYIIKRRKHKNSGLKAIFKSIHGRRRFDHVGELIIVNYMLTVLLDHKLPFTKKELYYLSRFAGKEDIPEERKQFFKYWRQFCREKT